jgi:hypothetical protein
VGRLLLGIAALHTLVGLAVGFGVLPDPPLVGAPLAGVLADGVLDAVAVDVGRVAVVWFLFFGLALALLGLLAHDVERRGLGLPRSLAHGLLGLFVVGVVLLPASGFWLAFAPLVLAYRRSGP